jgi:hypothetical protein
VSLWQVSNVLLWMDRTFIGVQCKTHVPYVKVFSSYKLNYLLSKMFYPHAFTIYFLNKMGGILHLESSGFLESCSGTQHYRERNSWRLNQFSLLSLFSAWMHIHGHSGLHIWSGSTPHRQTALSYSLSLSLCTLAVWSAFRRERRPLLALDAGRAILVGNLGA